MIAGFDLLEDVYTFVVLVLPKKNILSSFKYINYNVRLWKRRAADG